MDELIEALKKTGVFKNERIIAAFRQIDRQNFLPANLLLYAYADEALPIGFGQTISQPYTVVFMLSLLEPMVGEKIMDVGYGSGWQTALLAELVEEGGKIFALELTEELCDFGRKNIERNYPTLVPRISFYCQNAAPGLPEEASEIRGFDAIIAAAEVKEVPATWREQLKKGGRLVYPKGGSIFKETKNDRYCFTVEEYPGFLFVPFRTEF